MRFMPYQYNSKLTLLARQLRREQTSVEHLLWAQLRNRQILGCKFRRQVPFGQYILDFYCVEKKITIELDGGQHNKIKKSVTDMERTRYLERNGVIVLRFWNNEVRENLEGVLTVIEEKIVKDLT